jgi:hypothetical protein
VTVLVKDVWGKYKVGRPSTRRNWTEPSCQPFSVVRHITHIKDAIRIIEDEMIRSSLVWDESKLNNTRTCVSWVSPNTWAYGSIYGNISFEFSWKKLIRDKKIYWVEDITSCNPSAYRMLITSSDYSESHAVIPYPVDIRTGPIYYDGTEWFRNGNYTGEFLIDGDLSIDECDEIDFVDHHNNICSKFGNSCEDCGLRKYKAGSKFLANIIGRNLKGMRDRFWDNSVEECQLTFQAQGAISHFFKYFLKRCSKNKTTITEKVSIFIARSCLAAYSENSLEVVDNLVKLLGTKDNISNILKKTVEEYFECSFKDIFDW